VLNSLIVLIKVGVLAEMFQEENSEPLERRYIRSATADGTNFLIVCCTQQQAIEFLRLERFQCDLSYKLVAGKTYQFSFTRYSDEDRQRKSLYYH
jgi:hypothetical protein